ncbi:hypothetical protein K504DRAFT_466558 [Pleomassaria siparia CBS 279.74]|uniref:Transglutaminase-like domain-containing protein n=1 Tax=Pleomassaria siparia CBS 279.74 TaxID=1314801 RepID=A0A6G1KCG6_9PLEO|nr:hypothetical protein K504DRAFT_466558 [Pleomassaria siparia CBS 279.74]
MAEPPNESIREKIARMNLTQVHGSAPPAYSYYDQAPPKKKPPPPPPRPQVQSRQQTINNPPIYSNALHSNTHNTGNLPSGGNAPAPRISPALPPRPAARSSSQQSPALPQRLSPRPSPALPPRHSPRPSPALPPRKSSTNLRRQYSSESISTMNSDMSALTLGSTNGDSVYRVRAPLYDPATLPPLTVTQSKPQKEISATRRAMQSNTADRIDKRVLPPMLPPRTSTMPTHAEANAQQYLLPKKSQGLPSTRVPAISQPMNKSTEAPPPIPGRSWSAGNTRSQPGAPPPIPTSTRPNLNAIMASKPKPGATASCLKCRDFSGPDAHAAQFPRENIPLSDIGWLSQQLTSPFPSPTDKARAIFTWLHHNVDYDLPSLLAGTVCNQTPERTLRSGLAVCAGYAALFCDLALKAGLECLVITGDGKGYGYTPLQPGQPIPPVTSNHAWNAVCIDNGEWKLVDSCWGAGHRDDATQAYKRQFSPECFTMTNDEFGLKHFPMDNARFYRNDGRPSITWEEYCTNDVGQGVTVFGNTTPQHGLSGQSFEPKTKQIAVRDPSKSPDIRFQFSAYCPHWDNERHGTGKPYVMVLHVGGRDGQKTNWIPFETNGKTWWLDMDRRELGAPGQKVSIFAVNSFDNRDARGLTYDEYRAKKGKVAMGFDGIAMWELV